MLTGTVVSQDVTREGNTKLEGNADFFVLDATIGYRLPKQFGVLSIEGTNLFNTRFKYQDDSFRGFTNDPVVSKFTPERAIIATAAFNF